MNNGKRSLVLMDKMESNYYAEIMRRRSEHKQNYNNIDLEHSKIGHCLGHSNKSSRPRYIAKEQP